MSVKDDYLDFRDRNGLKTGNFDDRVKLQQYLRSRLIDIWAEKPTFAHGGLLENYMTRFAIGFAYYDCRPSSFCKTRCYGLRISGLWDYYMLRLGVMTSESFRTGNPSFLNRLKTEIIKKRLERLKIGHWGDAVPEQVPHIAQLVKQIPGTNFWWYTRKKEIAIEANRLGLANLRAYLSLDPTTQYPDSSEYPYGITYLFGDGRRHNHHDKILSDPRLIAIFPLKTGRHIDDPSTYGLAAHPKMCPEKKWESVSGSKGHELCLTSCSGRCNYV